MTDKLEPTQADIDLAEVIMRRVKQTIEWELGQYVAIDYSGLTELLARHRIEHTTQPQDEGLAGEIESLSRVFAEATDYYIQFHAGLGSASSDKIRTGIRAVLTTLRSPDTGTDKCDECGRPYSTIYNIPNDIWAQIAPKPESLGEHIEHQAGGMLCTDCTTNRARKIGIELRFVGTVGWSDVAETHGQEADAMAEVREALARIASGIDGTPAYSAEDAQEIASSTLAKLEGKAK